MAKLTIKNNSVKEANEPVSFGKAYQDFVGRCWRDTPEGKKPNYSERAINFMLDCAHIANGTAVKGLPQQGFALKKAHISELVGDCLHLQYSKDDGRKGVDVWLNPHSQKALVDLYGFNPERPYDSTHKEFDARNNDADEFAAFIESLPNYKGEAKTAESRKMTIRVHEANDVLSLSDSDINTLVRKAYISHKDVDYLKDNLGSLKFRHFIFNNVAGGKNVEEDISAQDAQRILGREDFLLECANAVFNGDGYSNFKRNNSSGAEFVVTIAPEGHYTRK